MHAREVFNGAAATYDAEMATSATQDVRLRVEQMVARHAPGMGAVLDFGCGTGADTTRLAERGRRVLAYDLSEGMLERLRERCATPIAEGRVVAVAGEMEDLYRALPAFGSVQTVVANFAVLNLLPDLSAFRELVTRRLPAVQAVILGVQNPFYLPDLRAGWWWRGMWKGRRAGEIVCDAGRLTTRRYYNRTLVAAFAPDFKLQETHGAWAPIRLLAFVRTA
jgi:SAM-dependent methyltransferase